MIDYGKSAELNGMEVEELKVYFEKFPKSEKRIIRICDSCGARREIYFYQYCDLCQPCSKKTPESRDSARLKTLEQWENPEYYNLQVKSHIEFHKDNPEWAIEQSERLLRYHEDHPEVGELHSERTIEQFSTQKARDAQREAGRVGTEKFIGGNDIINHHFIYDHNNPNQHIVKITRSQHASHHAWMRRNGLKVPHVNEHIPWRY